MARGKAEYRSAFGGPREKEEVPNEAVEILGGAGRLRAAAGRERDAGGRCVPPAGSERATFYVWKKRYRHLGVNEVRRVRQLEEEKSRLKRLVADLTLDKHMLAEALRNKV
jgi:putative transposase